MAGQLALHQRTSIKTLVMFRTVIMCICLLTDITVGSPFPPNTMPPTLSSITQPSIPQHHLTQWQGGCNEDCYNDPEWFCGLGRQDRRCHECSIFCEKEDFDRTMCQKECPALFDTKYQTPVVSMGSISSVQPSSVEPAENESTVVAITTVICSETDIDSYGSEQTTEDGTINTEDVDSQKLNTIDWRWLLGGVLLFVVITILLSFLIKKYRNVMCKPKPDLIPVQLPSQCSEGHERGPHFYTRGNKQNPAPCVQTAETSVPLLHGPRPKSPISQYQVHPEQQPPAISLHIDGPCVIGSTTPSCSNDKVLASGQEASFAYGDQYYSSTQV